MWLLFLVTVPDIPEKGEFNWIFITFCWHHIWKTSFY